MARQALDHSAGNSSQRLPNPSSRPLDSLQSMWLEISMHQLVNLSAVTGVQLQTSVGRPVGNVDLVKPHEELMVVVDSSGAATVLLKDKRDEALRLYNALVAALEPVSIAAFVDAAR